MTTEGKTPDVADAAPVAPTQHQRLLSLDALRGLDMFLIVGAGGAVGLLEGTTDWGWLNWMALQTHHAPWGKGFTFFDFIFPLFLFVSGVSIPFSLAKSQSLGHGNRELYLKAFKRMLILYCLGLIFKNVPVQYELAETRFGNVLGRIGIGGFVATVIYLNCKWRGQVAWFFGLIIAYWLAVMFIPVPGHGAGVLTPEGCLPGYIDRMLVPGRLIMGNYDENALSCTMPAISLVIMGTLAGGLLRNQELDPLKKGLYLVGGGFGLIVLALIWHLHFPISKFLWSSSFISLTSGMALISLAVFYIVIDVWQIKKWSYFFVVVGLNSITIYLAVKFIDFPEIFTLLFAGIIDALPAPFQPAFTAAGGLIIVWLFLYFLYRKKLFFKV